MNLFFIKMIRTVPGTHAFLGCALLAGNLAMSVWAQEPADFLKPKFTGSESFIQSYTVTAQFNDSTVVQIQYVLTNVGIGDRNPACKILLLSGEAPPLVWGKKFGSFVWQHASTPREQSLTMGPNRIDVDREQTRVVAGDDTLRAEITFDCGPATMPTPQANLAAKGRFYEYTLPLRWMPVHVVLKRAGALVVDTDGYGMFEVYRSTSFPAEICRGWISFRAYGDTRAFNANFRLPPGDSTYPTGWIWYGDAPAPVSIKGSKIAVTFTGAPKDHPAPGPLRAPDSSFCIRPGRLLCRYSFVDELGAVRGVLVRLIVGAPTVYFYRADVVLKGNDTPIPGILEVMRTE